VAGGGHAAEVIGTIRIPGWFQGPTGAGQGGWTAARLAELAGAAVTVRLRTPVPLDADLVVVREAGPRWTCSDGEVVVCEARPWEPDVPDTPPVSRSAAQAARRRFPVRPEDHPVPHCFSCGIQPDSMRVHAGPVGSMPERYATDWTAPQWAARSDGTTDPAALWAALDCTAAWYVSCHPTYRRCVTAQYAVEVLRPVEAGAALALVAWDGDWPGGWDGRKRGAASVAFDVEGRVVARARSLWVALVEDGAGVGSS
jgi:hypothetical protein